MVMNPAGLDPVRHKSCILCLPFLPYDKAELAANGEWVVSVAQRWYGNA